MLRFFLFFLSLNLTHCLIAQEYENYLSLTEHQAEVQNIRFSPKGNLLASASFDHTAMIWEMPSGKLIHTLHGHSDDILEVSFSADSKFLATASRDGSVKVWDLSNGKLKSTFYNKPFYHRNGDIYKAVTFVSFSADGRHLYFGGKSAYVMKVKFNSSKETAKEIHNTNSTFGNFKAITGGCLSQDGKLLFISTGKSVQLISLQNEKVIKTIDYPNALLNDVVAAPQSNLLSYWTENGNVILWNYLKGEKVQDLKVTTGGKENYSAISYSKNNELLTTGGFQNEAKIWNWKSGELITTLKGHTRVVRACKFSPSQNIIATASYDHTIKLWREKISHTSKTTQVTDNQILVSKKDTVFIYKNKIMRDTIYIYLRDTIYVEKTAQVSLQESDLQLDATINLKGIRFERGTSIFLSEAYPELERLYVLMRKHQSMEIELRGHTDNVGVKTLLFKLSEERIQKVKEYLIDRGISFHRIQTKAYGGTNPISTNHSEDSRRLNRRVEITILKL